MQELKKEFIPPWFIQLLPFVPRLMSILIRGVNMA